MVRYFNDREIELLAPAGTMADFEEIIRSGADAVYLGGKKFNMRVHRKDYNFSNEEIKSAIDIAHTLGKKIYVTFNNLMDDSELDEAKEFLAFLGEAGPDALIVQDMGALALIKEMNIQVPVHSSVMMNVHNKQMIEKLYEIGVSRIVASREMSLESIQNLSESTKMEFEYFIHGDMCVAHGAQCLYSGMLFGKSSNRGLCMKPCRWPFKDGDKKEYSLAVKDMSMYRHLPDLINSGVCSFKIEGRMRDSKYLVGIINIYREAIDRYIDDPAGYHISEDFMEIEKNKVRNLSTAYAFKIPGASNIDMDGKREPRVFSIPTKEISIKDDRAAELREIFSSISRGSKPLLTVRVNNLAALKSCVDNGADEIYFAGDVFRDDRPFTKEEIKEGAAYAKDKGLYIALPRMMDKRHFVDFGTNMEFYKEAGIKGILVTNLGALEVFKNKGLDLIGDHNLNAYNSKTIDFYGDMGMSRVTASVEAPASTLRSIIERSKTAVEVIVQGAPVVMYLEHCIYAARNNVTSKDWCLDYCRNNRSGLFDENGIFHPVFADQHCRNNMITSKDICYLPIIKEIIGLGAKALRIEGQHYSPEELGEVVKLYRNAIDELNSSYEVLSEITNREQGFGALNFD